MTLLFAGDPHRNFSPILRACLALPPSTLILLGDLDCPRPLVQEFAGVMEKGWDVRWILGNHDCETATAYDNLVTSHPKGDLGLRVTELDGLRVAGLPGVFKPSVWYPRSDDGSERIEPPRHHGRAGFLAAQPKARWWRGGLPLWHRDTIFPEDVERLATQRFDILVTHEAPSCHRHGFAVIDQLAVAGGARWIVHGHHHESYAAILPGQEIPSQEIPGQKIPGQKIMVRGLGLAETWEMPLSPLHGGQ